MRNHFSFVMMLATVVTLMLLWANRISSSVIEGDGAHTLRMGVNLAHTGTISLAKHAPYEPTMYREPVPALIAAASVAIIDSILGPAGLQEYLEGPRARLIKLQNIGWMLLLSVSTFAAVRLLTGSFVLGLAGLLLVNLHVPLMVSGIDELGIDTLQTDLAGASVLALASWLTVRGFMRQSGPLVVVAGAAFGILALIKASFLYVFIGFAAVLLIGGAVARLRDTHWPGFLLTAALMAGFAAITMPWMYRNYVHFGVFGVSERAGVVLYIRALKDLMSPEEYKGSFYVWAPAGLRPVVGRLLGFSENDLMRNGRLQRLNRFPTADFYEADLAAELAGRPDKIVSYYRQARAEREQLRIEAREIGSGAERRVDAVLQERAIGIIREHPGRHLALTIPFLWRGAFVAFPVLFAALLYAAWRRRIDLGLFILPAFGLVMFYASFSHFIPRYGIPTVPIVIVSALVLGHGLTQRMRSPRLSREQAPATLLAS